MKVVSSGISRSGKSSGSSVSWFLNGNGHDKVYLRAECLSRLVQETEVGVHQLRRIHGFELDEQIGRFVWA